VPAAHPLFSATRFTLRPPTDIGAFAHRAKQGRRRWRCRPRQFAVAMADCEMTIVSPGDESLHSMKNPEPFTEGTSKALESGARWEHLVGAAFALELADEEQASVLVHEKAVLVLRDSDDHEVVTPEYLRSMAAELSALGAAQPARQLEDEAALLEAAKLGTDVGYRLSLLAARCEVAGVSASTIQLIRGAIASHAIDDFNQVKTMLADTRGALDDREDPKECAAIDEVLQVIQFYDEAGQSKNMLGRIKQSVLFQFLLTVIDVTGAIWYIVISAPTVAPEVYEPAKGMWISFYTDGPKVNPVAICRLVMAGIRLLVLVFGAITHASAHGFKWRHLIEGTRAIPSFWHTLQQTRGPFLINLFLDLGNIALNSVLWGFLPEGPRVKTFRSSTIATFFFSVFTFAVRLVDHTPLQPVSASAVQFNTCYRSIPMIVVRLLIFLAMVATIIVCFAVVQVEGKHWLFSARDGLGNEYSTLAEFPFNLLVLSDTYSYTTDQVVTDAMDVVFVGQNGSDPTIRQEVMTVHRADVQEWLRTGQFWTKPTLLRSRVSDPSGLGNLSAWVPLVGNSTPGTPNAQWEVRLERR
jgi:hypothetical protein